MDGHPRPRAGGADEDARVSGIGRTQAADGLAHRCRAGDPARRVGSRALPVCAGGRRRAVVGHRRGHRAGCGRWLRHRPRALLWLAAHSDSALFHCNELAAVAACGRHGLASSAFSGSGRFAAIAGPTLVG